ncbi:MAG: substrate-binding domain-containing protein, partial [Oscillospiraceae bacterium]|nr:substrate-binding domain-containing protein [Oscillospiraceae bacterium]
MKKRNILIVAMACLLVFALMLTACAQQEAPAAEAPAAEAPATEAPATEAPAAPAADASTGGGQTQAEAISGGVEATGEPRMVEEREDATDGEPLNSPDVYTEAEMPGLESAIGVKPLKKYKVAFSNGDMDNDWRATFFNDFVEKGEYMKAQFGIDFIYANSGNDSAKQIQDIQALLAQKPDLLMFSPNESAPLATIYDSCKEAGIPFFTIDRSVEAEIGADQYICDIEGDNIADGLSMGMAIVEALTEKYGEPRGAVAEIAGQIGSSPAIHRSTGIRMIIEQFPDIQIVQVIDGQFDADTSNAAAQDIFTTHPDIDAVA